MNFCNIYFLLIVALFTSQLSYAKASLEERRSRILSFDFDFRLPAANSLKSISLLDYIDKNSLYLIPTNSKCETTEALLARYSKLKYSKSIEHLIIDYNREVNREEIEKNLSQKKIKFRYLFDPIQVTSRIFNIDNLHDKVFLNLDTGSWTKESGTDPTVNKCKITDDLNITHGFKENFLIPFSISCQHCHISDEQFDQFQSLDITMKWKNMILKTIQTGRMPGVYDPYHFPHGEKTIKNDHLFNIYQWLSTKQAITEEMKRDFAENRKYLKNLISLKTNKNQILKEIIVPKLTAIPNAQGSYYQYVKLQETTQDDIFLEGIMLDTDVQTSHHVILYAFPPGRSIPTIFENLTVQNQGISSMEHNLYLDYWEKTPRSVIINSKKVNLYKGVEPILLTVAQKNGFREIPGAGHMKIPKGSTFAVAIHNELNGIMPRKNTQVQIVGSLKPRDNSLEIYRISLNIPPESFLLKPNTKDYLVQSKLSFNEKIKIHSVFFHGHNRFRSASLEIKNYQKKKSYVLKIPQINKVPDSGYFFPKNGIDLDKGKLINFSMLYDNSYSNPNNHDPCANVLLGGNTYENEMHVITVFYSKAN